MQAHEHKHLCPRCEFNLVPVYAAERGRRRVIALTCPEPYCDHMQMVAKSDARKIERSGAAGAERQRAAT